MKSDTLPLLHMAQAGNRDAMALLIRRYAALITAVATRYGRRPGCGPARADLQQDAILAFMQAVNEFQSDRPGGQFTNFARQVMRRDCYDASVRYGSRFGASDWMQRHHPEPACVPFSDETDPAGDGGMEAAFSRLLLAQLVRTLPVRDRELVARTYGLGGRPRASVAAAGRSLGMTPQTARRRHKEALACLRGQIGKEGQ